MSKKRKHLVETAEEAPPEKPKTAKNRDSRREVHGIGSIPDTAATFRLEKIVDGQLVKQTVPLPDGAVAREWEIKVLTLPNVRQSFGNGFFRVTYINADRKGCGQRDFEVREPAKPNPEPQKKARPDRPMTQGELELERERMHLEATEKILHERREMLREFGAPAAPAGMSAADVEARVTAALATERQIAEANARADRAELRLELLDEMDEDESDEDDDEPTQPNPPPTAEGLAACTDLTVAADTGPSPSTGKPLSRIHSSEKNFET